MDPVNNPFAPGAGSQPPQLAGRESIVSNSVIALKRIRIGRHSKSQLLLGLRGVGKTVLLNHVVQLADDEGYLTSVIEAPEGQGLADMLAPQLRVLLFRLSGFEKARVIANRTLSALRSFASAFSVSFGEFDGSIRPDSETAATGHLETDLRKLMQGVAEAARAAEKPVALFIDEMQYITATDLGALIASMHQVSQKGLPLVLFGAGLPQLAGLAGDAKSYAERLFDFTEIGPLDREASRDAVRKPIRDHGADITEDALKRIFKQTEGYPYFLQEWGHHSWDVAPKSPIELKDVVRASKKAVAALDASFFRVRLNRLSPREQAYLRAMATLGPGPHRSGAIAKEMRIDVTLAGSVRTGLIRQGMIFSPSHGLTAFTVPMFDEFMRRAIPVGPVKTAAKKKRSGMTKAR
jgi:hypothetical protein